MEKGTAKKVWERTPVTNLLRNGQSGTYYARVKISGKQKWRTLKTKVFSVAKLRLADVEREERSKAGPSKSVDAETETTVGRYISLYLDQTKLDSSLAETTKFRRETAVKALLKTWPDLPFKDVRRLSPGDCEQWAARARREGTGFVAPKAKTVRKGISGSAFNKVVDALRAILEIARKAGLSYANSAAEVSKAQLIQKTLELPSVTQFHTILKSIAEAGARQSRDCADMVQLLAYSGARLNEATALRWSHVDDAKGVISIPGTKSATSRRVIPLFPPLKKHLEQLRTFRGQEPSDAPLLRVHECKGALRTACKAIGIKPINHHDLRHLFATRCIESGMTSQRYRDGSGMLMAALWR